MRFSVVTISFNQAEFLERAMRSVLEQDGVDVEYTVVDPGSTDGSRAIIERHRPALARVIFEPDKGPADGLNKGFEHTTGDVFCYVNADDAFEPDAFKRVAATFERRPDVDVLCGHAWIVDGTDRRLRRVWSDPFDRLSQAYGMSIQVQPSTFIRRDAFRRTGGFNIENRSNWDGELMVTLARNGAKIEVIDEFLSLYRLHATSITNSGSRDKEIQKWRKRHFELLMGREWTWTDDLVRAFWKIRRQFRNPAATLERLRHGPVYRRGA